MKKPGLQEEKALWKKGYKWIVGLDEVGRGPLAGPVIAAAVALKNSNLKLLNIKDSKKLSPKRRKELYDILTKNLYVEWGIGKVYPKAIDRMNILEATKLAMKRAVNKIQRASFAKQSTGGDKTKSQRPLKAKIDYLILDGKMKLDLDIPQKSIVKADEKVVSCAIASIIAKVKRDRAMQRYHKKYPQYGFDRHKGYGTKHHLKMLKKLGRCAIHRNSFNYHGSSQTKTYQI